MDCGLQVTRSLGFPGPVDYDAGMLLWAPHLPESWTTALTNEELTNCLDLPVFIANDADLAAVGEATFGAGKGIPDVAYLTISTGIGAGIICGGQSAAEATDPSPRSVTR